AISSQNSACCISVALRPPYSLGQQTAAQRPSWSFRCHARRYGNDSSRGFSRHSFQSIGAFAASHARSSSRNANSSAVRFKSIDKTPSLYLFRVALHAFVFNTKQISSQKTGSGAALSCDKVRTNRIRAVPILFAEILFQDFSSC